MRFLIIYHESLRLHLEAIPIQSEDTCNTCNTHFFGAACVGEVCHCLDSERNDLDLGPWTKLVDVTRNTLSSRSME